MQQEYSKGSGAIGARRQNCQKQQAQNVRMHGITFTTKNGRQAHPHSLSMNSMGGEAHIRPSYKNGYLRVWWKIHAKRFHCRRKRGTRGSLEGQHMLNFNVTSPGSPGKHFAKGRRNGRIAAMEPGKDFSAISSSLAQRKSEQSQESPIHQE